MNLQKKKMNVSDEVYSPPCSVRQPVILIVEDDPITLSFYQAISRAWRDVKVVFARDGSAALAHAIENISLVLLDIGLPGMDGIEVCKLLRDKNSDVPIIICSAHVDMSEQIALCEQAGANAVFIKPLLPEKIENVIKSWLHSKKALVIQEKSIDRSLYAMFGKLGYQLIPTKLETLLLRCEQYCHENLGRSPFEVIVIVEETIKQERGNNKKQETAYSAGACHALYRCACDVKSQIFISCNKNDLGAIKEQLAIFPIADYIEKPFLLTELKIFLDKEKIRV